MRPAVNPLSRWLNDLHNLPAGTSPGTRRRIGEYLAWDGYAIVGRW